MATTKKILISFILVMLMFTTVGCSCSKSVDVEQVIWNEDFIELVVGESYTLDAEVLPTNASNQAIYYSDDGAISDKGGENYVIERRGGNTIVAMNEGVAVVTAMSRQNTSISANITVRVYEEEITLSAPTGLVYNTATRRIEWEPTKYYLGSREYAPTGYIVELNGVEQELNGNTYFDAFEPGVQNEVRVKAIGTSKAIHDSVYSTTISFKTLPTPTGLERTGNMITWNTVEGASSYTIRVDGEVYMTNITTNSTQIDFDEAGSFAVTVEAVPDASQDSTLYPSKPSDAISIVKLSSISQLSINNSAMYWNEVVGAVEYIAVFTTSEGEVRKSAGLNTFININDIAQIPAGQVTASVVAVNNSTSGFDSNNDVTKQFEKLATPNNMQIVSNALQYSGTESAESYSISVNGEESDIQKGEWYSLPASAPSGEYAIKMRANGNGSTTISSNWTSDENVFNAIKLTAPTSVTNTNDKIVVNAVTGASAYEYKDTTLEENNIYQAKNIETIEQNTQFDLVVNNKVTKIQQVDQNYFNIAVKAKGADGGNYFDSDYSTVTTSFHKLIAPVNYKYTSVGEGYTFTWALYEIWCAESRERNILGHNGTRVNIIYDDCNPFGMIAGDFGDISNLSQHSTKTASQSTLTAFNSLSELFANFMQNFTVPTDGTEFIPTISSDALNDYTEFYNKAIALYNNSLVSFTKNLTGDLTRSAMIGVNHPYTMAFGTEINPENINFQTVIANLFGFASKSEFMNYAQELADTYAQNRTNIANNTNTNKALENGCFYASNGSFIFPIAVKNELSSTVLTYVILDTNGLVSVWVNDITAALWATNFNATYHTQNVINNQLYCKNILFVTGPELQGEALSVVWKAVKRYVINGLNQPEPVFHYNFTFSDTEGNVLYTRLVGVEDDETLSLDELTSVGGGAIKIAISIVGNGTDVVTSDYTSAIEGRRMYEPQNLVVNQNNLNFTTEGDYEDSEYYLVLVDDDEEKLVAKSTTKSFDLDNLTIEEQPFVLVSGQEYDFKLYTLGTPQENSPYYKSLDSFITIQRLEAPSITRNANYIEWDKVENALGYEVWVDGSKVDAQFSEQGNKMRWLTVSDAGEHSVVVYAINDGEDNIYMKSTASNSVTFTRLEISELSIQNNILSWQEISGAKYLLQIYKAGESEILSSKELTVTNIDLRTLNLVGGAYNVNIIASLQGYVDSNAEDGQIGFNVLNAPSIVYDVAPTNSIITWQAVSRAIGYKLAISYVVGDDTVVDYTNIITSTSYDLTNSEVVGGVLTNITISAIGDGSVNIDSIYYDIENPLDFAKLSTPINLAGQVQDTNYTLTWDNIDGAKYEVYLNGTKFRDVTEASVTLPLTEFDTAGEYVFNIRAISADASKPSSSMSADYVVTKYAETTGLAVVDNHLTWTHNEGAEYTVKIFKETNLIINEVIDEDKFDLTILDTGIYSAVVVTEGNGTTSLSGDATPIDNIEVLAGTDGFALDNANKKLTWNDVTNENGYVVVYTSGDQIVRQKVDTNEAYIPTQVVAGDWVVGVRVAGNGGVVVDSPISNTIEVTKLSQATDITFSKGTLTFTKVEGFEEYEIIITKDSQSSSISYTYDNDGIELSIEDAGIYAIGVITKGDYLTNVDSNPATLEGVIRLEVSSEISISNNVLTWSEVENATGYIVYLNGEDYECDTNSLDVTTLALDKGTYTVSIVAVSSEDKVLDSASKALDQNITILGAVQSITITNNKTITFTSDNASQESGYVVNYITDDGATSESFTVGQEVIIKTDLASGEYNINIITKGNSAYIVDSKPSATIHIVKPVAPTTLSHQSENITITPIEGYDNYIIKITIDGQSDYVYATTTDSVKHYDFAQAGDYDISFAVFGDSSTYINSNYSESISVTRLASVEGLKIKDNKVTFDANTIVANNDFEYEIIFKGTNNKIYTTKQTEFECTDELSAETYEITVRCLAGDETRYLPSDYAKVENVTKLSAPTITGIQNNKVVWTTSQIGVVGYEVKVVCGDDVTTNVISDVNTKEFELGDEYEAGVYDVSVRALGDGISYIKSNYSQSKQVTKLDAPNAYVEKLTNDSTSDFAIKWQSVSNATGYIVYVGDTPYPTSNNYLSIDAIADLSDGISKAKVIAVGDNADYVNSKKSNEVSFSITDGDATAIALKQGKLVWQAVSGAVVYVLDINNVKVNVGNVTEYSLGTEYNTGDYTIKIKAYRDTARGTDNVVVNSSYSEAVTGYKLARPNNPVIKDGYINLTEVTYRLSEEETTPDPETGSLKPIFRTFEYEYGTNASYMDVALNDAYTVNEIALFSNMVGQKANFRYRALGDDLNFTSDWSDSIEPILATQLATITNINMEDGLLQWDKVENAAGYKIFGQYQYVQDGQAVTQYVEVATVENSYFKPFASHLGKENLNIIIHIIATGDSHFTNSSPSESKIITYLATPNTFKTDKGMFTWSGGLSDFELTIDNAKIVKITETNTYDFASEDEGRHYIKVKALGDGAFVVDSEYSSNQTLYKLGTPEHGVYETFFNNGKLQWSTNIDFILGLTNNQLNSFQPLGNSRIYSYYSGVLEEEEDDSVRTDVLDIIGHTTQSLQSLYYAIQLDYYFDSLRPGAYTFKIANLGNSMLLTEGIGYITSSYSVEFNVQILKRAEDVYIEDAILHWNNVENNNGYNLIVDKGADNIVKIINVPKDNISYDLLSLGLEADTYSVYLRTVGNNNLYLTSRATSNLVTTILQVPTAGDFAFTIQDGKIAWNRVSGASGYTVEVVNVENNETFEYDNVEFEDVNGIITYRLPESLNPAVYKLRIKALGDGVKYLNSVYGDYGQVTKLAPIDKIGNYLGRLEWRVAYFDGLNAVDKYEIDFIGVTNGERYNFIISYKNGDFYQEDNQCYYELDDSILYGDYYITVRAVGEVVTQNNIRTLYASSSLSGQIRATRLAGPADVYVSEGIIKWNYTGNGHSGFYLVIDGQTYDDSLITLQQSEFRDESGSGRHTLAIKVVGNTLSASETGTRLLSSSITGAEITVEKLNQIATLYIQDGILYFTGVENASKYEVIAQYGDRLIKSQTSNYDSEKAMYYFELLGENYPSGEYSRIEVRAIGDNYYVNSAMKRLTYSYNEDDYNNVFKLTTPTEVSMVVIEQEGVEHLYLRWRGVLYTFDSRDILTTKYRLKVEGENDFIKYVDFEVNDDDVVDGMTGATYFEKNMDELFSTLFTGTYIISLQAVPLAFEEGKFNALNSEYTLPMQITKPDTATNVRFDNQIRAFVWDAPSVEDGIELEYEIFYMYRATINAEPSLHRVIVDSPIYYPSDLGVYNIAVRAIVSNSLASDYIGVDNNKPYLNIKNLTTGVEQEWYNFDEIEIVFEDDEYYYYIDNVQYEILNFVNAVVGAHDLYAGGNGSASNPYQISSAEEFARMSFYYRNNVYFVQTANIDFAGNSTYSVGSESKPFSGVYDGGGYVISNVRYSVNDPYMGLFDVTSGATIQNVTITNASMSISRIERTNAGFLVGYATSTRITNCVVKQSQINITYSSSNAISYYLGGIVGYATGSGSFIKDCYNEANIVKTVTSSTLIVYSGGIVGYISTTNDVSLGIINCGNAGAITGTWVGGLAGSANCQINNSYNLATITGVHAENMEPNAGGLVGRILSTGSVRYIVNNCYNTGNVTSKSKVNGKSYAGGLAGRANCLVFNFYNGGTVIADSMGVASTSNQYYGWLIGFASESITISNVYTIVQSLVNPLGSGSYSGNFEVLTADNLASNVTSYLGDAFTYSTTLQRVVLKIEI